MDVEIAEYSGYCFGVKNALKLTRKALAEKTAIKKKVYTLGSIIHNPGVVQELSSKGLISVSNVEDIENDTVFVVRSHGIAPITIKALKKKNIEIIDATCPFVKKAQTRARRLAKDGFHVVVIGDKNHPEVRGIEAQVDKNRISVVNGIEDIKSLDGKKKIGVVVQTTQTMEKLKNLVCRLLDSSRELYIANTICSTTKKRQDSIRELAKRTDMMLVIGGKNSANTTHLADISRENNPNTFHIENSCHIKKEWFKNTRKVGISGGASTPEKDILEIKKKIEDIKI